MKYKPEKPSMNKPEKPRKKSKILSILSNVLFRTILFVFSFSSIKTANAKGYQYQSLKDFQKTEKQLQKVVEQEEKNHEGSNIVPKRLLNFKKDLLKMRKIWNTGSKEFFVDWDELDSDEQDAQYERNYERDKLIESYYSKKGIKISKSDQIRGAFYNRLRFFEDMNKIYLKKIEEIVGLKKKLDKLDKLDSAEKQSYKKYRKYRKLESLDSAKNQNHLTENQSYKKLESLDSAKNQKNSDEKKDENFDTLTALIILYYIKSLK